MFRRLFSLDSAKGQNSWGRKEREEEYSPQLFWTFACSFSWRIGLYRLVLDLQPSLKHKWLINPFSKINSESIHNLATISARSMLGVEIGIIRESVHWSTHASTTLQARMMTTENCLRSENCYILAEARKACSPSVGARSLGWIRTSACGAGDLGFKSQRARQQPGRLSCRVRIRIQSRSLARASRSLSSNSAALVLGEF